MRHTIAATCAALALVPTLARAAEPPCLSPAEFTSLAEYALPSIITGTTQRCSPSLGASAYLPKQGTQLAARYAERRANAWPGAKAAFLKLSSTTNTDANNIIRTLPDPSLQQMLASLMEGLAAQQIPLDRCITIDRIVGLLAPLPAQNTAELIALAVGLGSKTGKAKLGSVAVCSN